MNMKDKILGAMRALRDGFKAMVKASAWATAVTVGLSVLPVQGQVDVTSQTSWLGGVSNVAGSAALTVNITNYLPQNQNWGIWSCLATTNNSGSNITFVFGLIPDGTNMVNDKSILWTFPLTSYQGCVAWTNWGTTYDNCRKVVLRYITNGHSATLWVSNVVTQRR